MRVEIISASVPRIKGLRVRARFRTHLLLVAFALFYLLNHPTAQGQKSIPTPGLISLPFHSSFSAFKPTTGTEFHVQDDV